MVTSINLWNEMAPRLLPDQQKATPANATIELIDKKDLDDADPQTYKHLLENTTDRFYSGLHFIDHKTPRSISIFSTNRTIGLSEVIYSPEYKALGPAGLALVLGTTNKVAKKAAKTFTSDEDECFMKADQFQQMMADIDKNKDGAIGPEERKTYLNQYA